MSHSTPEHSHSDPAIDVPKAWASLVPSSQTHFRLHFFGAVLRVIVHLRRLSDQKGLERAFGRFPFLTSYLEVLRPYLPEGLDWEASIRWWSAHLIQWDVYAADRSPQPLPLFELAQQGFSSHALHLLVLVGLVEEDARFGGLFADLQAPLAQRRPCLELLRQLLALPDDAGEVWEIARSLLEAGLIEPQQKEVPRAEWVFRVPALLWDPIRGRRELQPTPGLRFEPPERLAELSSLIVPDALRSRLERLPRLLQGEVGGTEADEDARVEVFILRGPLGSHREQVLGAVARELGRGALLIKPSGRSSEAQTALQTPLQTTLGPLCILLKALPILVLELSPGETAELPAFTGYTGPLGVMMGPEGGLVGPRLQRALTLELPHSGLEDRKRAWMEVLDGTPVEDLDAIAGRFLLPLSHLRQVAQQAKSLASLERSPMVTLHHVQEASEALNRQQLDSLAHRLEPEGGWERLVVSAPVLEKLKELEYRCRNREQVKLGEGFGTSGPRGVRALLTGPSGTGKTLAAQVLAARLEKSIYRVDLASVVNKYIGETEKNLHQVLARAEALDVILLIDEGDALLGNRTQVRSANDRYANLETNYLLQRIEHYQGIVLVTTNAADHIDSAFQRRMDVVVCFLHPQPEQRKRIWKLHLPETHAVTDGLLESVSSRCALTGGQIRNATMHAALLAAGAGGVIRDSDLEAALYSEYRKAGAVCPLHPVSRGQGKAGMGGFVSLLRTQGKGPTQG